jgi:hypothetical protein
MDKESRSRIFWTASAIDVASNESKMKPLTPSQTNSSAAPQFELHTTGNPQAMASLITRPQGSLMAGWTKQQAWA